MNVRRQKCRHLRRKRLSNKQDIVGEMQDVTWLLYPLKRKYWPLQLTLPSNKVYVKPTVMKWGMAISIGALSAVVTEYSGDNFKMQCGNVWCHLYDMIRYSLFFFTDKHKAISSLN
jgi:hypothetical protein